MYLRLNVLRTLMVTAFVAGMQTAVQAAPQATASQKSGGCDLATLAKSKAEFLRLSALRDAGRSAVSDEELRQASTDYVVRAEACYQALYADSVTTHAIDDGGVWFSPVGSQPFATPNFGTKWGAGSPYTGGVYVAGPRIAGGTVTYSFMASGISVDENAPTTTVAISSLPNYSPCFLTEIGNALAAWSAVANIRFVQVADNGVAFNASGATGDIRIAAHPIGGNVLAHAYYPPPNGSSAAGDVHFSTDWNWSCTPGTGIDIGIVATHEFGHSIGLAHETTNTAIMNPTYNSSVPTLLADDINGASSIYGVPPPATTSRTGDFDGDGRSEVAVFRPSNGAWYVLQSNSNYSGAFHRIWGQVGDIPVPGDFDGDGKKDIVVFRPSNGAWYILQSSTNFATFVYYFWGQNGDVPVQGDFDGDGKADAAVYRPSSGEWRVLRSTTNYTDSFVTVWGQVGDIPVPGDFDGDGRTDIVVYRPSNGAWYILQSNANYTGFFFRIWGLAGDNPVQGDFDGDGKADVVVYRPSNGAWYVLQSNTNYTGSFHRIWGLNGDLPVPGDFDGDSRTDIVVYRPSNGAWYILQSSTNFNGFVHYTWGLPGDIPVLQRP